MTARQITWVIGVIGALLAVWLWRRKHPIWAAFFGLGALANILTALRADPSTAETRERTRG